MFCLHSVGDQQAFTCLQLLPFVVAIEQPGANMPEAALFTHALLFFYSHIEVRTVRLQAQDGIGGVSGRCKHTFC